MRNFLLVSALSFGLSVVGHADTTFHLVNNTYSDGNTPPELTGVATGTVNIDTVAGVFDSVDINLSLGRRNYIFTGAPDVQSAFDNNTQYFEYTFDADSDALTIDVPGASLVGYTGGSLCSLSNLCDGFAGNLELADGVTYYVATAGSLATTPEPSSVILLGTGLLATAGAVRRRMSVRGVS